MLLARRNNEQNWLNNWFDDSFFDTDLMPRVNATAPAVNVKENDKAYVMDIAAPGLKKEFVRMNVDQDGNLNVAIENKMEHKQENKKEHYLRREFSYSNYEQTYVLPDDVDKDKISAKVNDGILEINMPKLAPQEINKTLKKINIE
ncbi:Hsp20/alpha crystallin family protein [Segatella albensis]|jgi:HSP20 family protein|uniref:Hsp20/alpha crystallin family protein n=1 Tax=Segatella albensis TaxID=77768 RepID=UPI00041F03F8|nr:Hsp20/alpha crystallin family protein [Segatella albensis]